MGTRLGRNQKWIIAPRHRARLHAMFTEVFEAGSMEPMPDVEIFKLDDGEQIGVFFEETALDEGLQRRGTWLELLVEDPDATAKRLDAFGLARIEYFDREHVYFQAPGGPVFRLAR